MLSRPSPLLSNFSMNRTQGCVLAAALAMTVAFSGGPLVAPAAAQYFGRNKVQYKSFKFETLKTEHFDIYFYPSERAMVDQAGRMAERWYARLSHELGYGLTSRQPLILYASHPDFEQTNAIEGELDEGTGGVTEPGKRRIVLPVAGPLAETDHVIGHELVHAFQFDLTGQKPTSAGFAEPAILRLPLWFIEGMAEYLSIGPVDPNTAMWMRDAAANNRLPTVRTLDSPRYFPYRFGQAFWAYVAHRWGQGAVGRVLKAAGHSGDAQRAITEALGITPDSLSKDWQRSVREWYAPIAAATLTARQTGRTLEVPQHGRGVLNVAPALSPDGKQLVFFSEKDIFSIDMFLADAMTGKVIRKLTRTAVDPHLQSLEFISSAGAWSKDGRRFVFSGVVKGRPILRLLDVEAGRTVKEIPLHDLGEVLNPTWSPDGQRIAFAALAGGVTDLFWLDLETRELHRITNDFYADLQPTWSPDGRSIAFVTDRFSTDLDSLRYGNYRLASLDVASGDIRPLPGFADAKNINPQWSPDGKHIYFVSDRNGIADVYRLDLGDTTITQLTNLRTGVSGITSLSPAISYARAADRLVFTAYEKDAYDLYAIDSLTVLAGRPPTPLFADNLPGMIPVGNIAAPAESDTVSARPVPNVLANPSAFTVARYSSRLSLDYFAQPTIGVGTGSTGFVAGGGTALHWSDMLGNHQLTTVIQIDTGGGPVWNNSAIGAFWENRRTRADWGLGAIQYPIISRDFLLQTIEQNGQLVDQEIDFRFWEIHRDVLASMAYPLSRVQRVELTGGYSNISFPAQAETITTDAFSGQQISDNTGDLPTFPALNFATAGAALVYDNSVFGGTSPVLGHSYRFEADGNVGSIKYWTALVDYRRYVPLPGHLTFATRLLHYGRYGSGGEDPRLVDLVLGFPYLVRGFNDGSFSSESDTAVFNRLFGSRLAVANFEVRLPLLGVLGIIPSRGVPPVELAAFFDAGAAWTSEEKVRFLNGPRNGVSSYGGALRVSLLGFAVAELDLVHPNQRPGKSWYWEFSLQPGF